MTNLLSPKSLVTGIMSLAATVLMMAGIQFL